MHQVLTFVGTVSGFRAYLAGIRSGKVIDINQLQTRAAGQRQRKKPLISG